MARQGFTLLEMIVATTIMAVAIVGLLAGLSGSTHNAARLQDYDRAVELGRERMNELIMDLRLPRDTQVTGTFDPSVTGSLDAGWRARVTTFEYPPEVRPGETVLDRVELEVWWKSGAAIRTFTLEAYRPRVTTPDDVTAAAAAAVAKGNP
jgi:prepilin-type N-terminal cleavage/methylation domain-containing protein